MTWSHHICSEPVGTYSTATARLPAQIRAIDILAGYGPVKSHLSTMSFCPVRSYDSPVMDYVTGLLELCYRT